MQTNTHETITSNYAVNSHSTVMIHFDLILEDGSVAESTRASGKPTLFQLGDGTLSTELEAQLIGLSIGDTKNFTLPPHAVFGEINPNLIQYFTPRDFIETGLPTIGTIMMFNTANGNQMAGVIKAITEDSITVDFNHPLAGKTVEFKIEIIDIDPIDRLDEID
ncbi:FKBP-type peptidyl-prolyl cis-trans isomerase [Thorsellia anophelis]|uniref:Peptidyl-prolyl cis-trans isomerase n=1 Tax=Thorsellia anophelis DSM 18579 TaxID=1123402 RepID=A0A1H9Y6V2_9GAMM|nr:FKBP-type peptidyl-prolyl cis-trans isomerase [Thorsellia anophelis]SES64459.1 FKBP-type peptidyl-prolyl cis-trans isomerase SlpA [Thorsellia anophelis DSM 18579]